MPRLAQNPASYEETLSWLLRLEAARGMDFKLDRVREALEILGNPQLSFRSIHIAGTNGKGSVAATIESVLRHHAIRTGLYTSPHLVDFRERVRIGQDWIPREAVIDLIDEIRELTRPEDRGLTFFEVSTILAFLHFARAGIDVAVIEVGLGGRLDATNVVDAEIAAITSVGFDHEAFLGNTLASIAREKAGILKPGRAAIIGPLREEAADVVSAAARASGATPFVVYGREFAATMGSDGLSYWGPSFRISNLHPALRGPHQVANTAVALAACEQLMGPQGLSEDLVRHAVANVRWPGRFEIVHEHPLVVLDAAHNPDGVRSLVQSLHQIANDRSLHLVFAVMADKRWREMVEILAPEFTTVTATSVPMERSAVAREVGAAFAHQVATTIEPDPCAAVRRAIAVAGDRGVVVVAGSIFLLGAVYSMFRSMDPSDVGAAP